ncbi:toll-like receptor 1 [Anabrus simplex]|uniref:toll-like receptor 1 n=1 Tax=Anabrus simplex TaxID=316456 RepID=UPI0035A3A9D9
MRLDFDPRLVSMSRLERVGDMLRQHEKTRDVWISHGDWVRVDAAPWNMSHLTELVLSWNHIEHLDTGWLKPLRNVILLNLEHNNLKTVPNGIRFLRKLKYLDLSFNPVILPDIQLSWILHGFRELNLSLASTPLKHLPGLLLRGETSPSVLFRQLDLSFCNISLVPEEGDIFHRQYLLEVINLSYNALHFIPPTIVTGLLNLRILDLSHNCLKHGPKFDISGHILHSLDLSWNMLDSADDIVEKGSVHKLNLSHNKINSWRKPYVFLRNGEGNPWVNYLDLSHNLISSFGNGMVEAISHLRTVDLGENVINCYDCSVREFQVWLSRTNSVVNLGVRGPLLCGFPEGFHGSRSPVVTFNVPDDRCFVTNNVAPTTVVGVILAIAAVIIVFSVFVTVICYTSRYDVSYSVHLLAMKKKWNMLLSKSGRKYDVFISYSEEDRDYVMSKLAKGMEGPPYNLKASLRHRDLTLGSSIVEGALTLIYNSRNTVVVLSHNYIDSQWCRAEMEHIRRAGHNMVLLEREQLERWRLSPEIRYLMDTRVYLPWQEGEDKPWIRVAEALTGKSVHGKLL